MNLVAQLLQFSVIAFTSIFVLVDPFAAIPAFLAMTSDSAETRRRRMAARAAWTCLTVLTVFSIAGSFIFSLFGITLPAFKIAGGIAAKAPGQAYYAACLAVLGSLAGNLALFQTARYGGRRVMRASLPDKSGKLTTGSAVTV